MAAKLPQDLALFGSLSANLVGFCRLLRRAGAAPGMGEQQEALAALERIELRDPEAFRLALRTTLAKSTREQQVFDRLFALYWQVWDRASELNRPEPQQEAPERTGPPRQKSSSFTSVREWLRQGDPTEEEHEAAGYSPIEVITRKDFKDFSAAELELIARLIQELARSLATRLSRRWRPARRPGRLDLQRTLRAALRRGGELIDLSFRQRRRKRLKLVLLCDVSKSMDLYSRFLIQFIYAFQSAYRRLETFVFSTSLHRVTPILKDDNLSQVLDELAASVPDWSGGTRIGASLSAFLRHYPGLIDPYTVVLIISDGWDTGDLEALEESMRALQRRSRFLVWLNPLLGSPGYRPSTRGMQVALPYIDLFAPAHNADSLRGLVRSLAGLRGPTPARFRRPEKEFTRSLSNPEPVPSPGVDFWLKRFGVRP